MSNRERSLFVAGAMVGMVLGAVLQSVEVALQSAIEAAWSRPQWRVIQSDQEKDERAKP